MQGRSTEAEIAAEVAFIHNDMHWRDANNRKSTTGHPNSVNNLKQIALAIPKLMGGKGITYTNTRVNKTVHIFEGKYISRNDDLVDLRRQAAKIVSRSTKPMEGVLFDGKQGWTIDQQLGIWQMAKERSLSGAVDGESENLLDNGESEVDSHDHSGHNEADVEIADVVVDEITSYSEDCSSDENNDEPDLKKRRVSEDRRYAEGISTRKQHFEELVEEYEAVLNKREVDDEKAAAEAAEAARVAAAEIIEVEKKIETTARASRPAVRKKNINALVARQTNGNDKLYCADCLDTSHKGVQFVPRKLICDHILALCLWPCEKKDDKTVYVGDPHSLYNLQLLCGRCDVDKTDNDMEKYHAMGRVEKEAALLVVA